MVAAGPLQTFNDLYTDLQNRVRLQTGVTATENQAKRYINLALEDMHVSFTEKWPWAERQATLLTGAQYTTGTLSVSQGGTAVVGVGTAWNTANSFAINNVRAGGRLLIAGSLEPNDVLSVQSDTQLTLSQPFVATAAAAAGYVYFEDRATLPAAFLRPIDAQFFDSRAEIQLLSRTEFRRRFTSNWTPGRPQYACIVDAAFSGSTAPRRQIQFARPPDQNYNIPYSYITANLAVTAAGVEQNYLINDTDEPIVYLRYRMAIVLHALYNWYRDKKDDQRSAPVQQEYIDLLSRVALDQEVGSPRPQISPNVGPYQRAASRPYGRSRGRRYDVNGAFDRME